MSTMTETLRIDIWSDVVCPWCAIGKANLDTALADFEHSDNVEIVWHSYELDPTAPAARAGNYVGMLAKKYGVTDDEAQVMIDRMTATGVECGVEFRFDIVPVSYTHLRAHETVLDLVCRLPCFRPFGSGST